MRIVIPGGTGQIGSFTTRWLRARGHEVHVVGRSVPEPELRWDGRSDGPWMDVIDGADVVLNLAGRSVNCRYHWRNLAEMMRSRVDSAAAVGRAIARATSPPRVWLQASTATIYADTRGTPWNEDGDLGGTEPHVPAYWAYSVHIARAWEAELRAAKTPHTRKVALRTGFTMSPDRGGVFDYLVWLCRVGLGGTFLPGHQRISWLYDEDYARIVQFLIDRDDLEGPVNLVAPHPISNAAFMRVLRGAVGAPVGLPVLPGMAELGAVFLRTDVELMRKSRNVAPGRLLAAGFEHRMTTWEDAAEALVRRWRGQELLGTDARTPPERFEDPSPLPPH